MGGSTIICLSKHFSHRNNKTAFPLEGFGLRKFFLTTWSVNDRPATKASWWWWWCTRSRFSHFPLLGCSRLLAHIHCSSWPVGAAWSDSSRSSAGSRSRKCRSGHLPRLSTEGAGEVEQAGGLAEEELSLRVEGFRRNSQGSAALAVVEKEIAPTIRRQSVGKPLLSCVEPPNPRPPPPTECVHSERPTASRLPLNADEGVAAESTLLVRRCRWRSRSRCTREASRNTVKEHDGQHVALTRFNLHTPKHCFVRLSSAAIFRFLIAIHSNMVKVFGVSIVATIISVFGWSLYRSVHNRRAQPFVEPHVCNEEHDHDVGDCLEGANVLGSEGCDDDPILEPNHKIFLSHSGAQKEFVEHLCKALEDRWYNPFFDRLHESLPKGERFAELIIPAAEQCEMLIVVVSEEYFMSKWPMIELNAFVKAHKLHRGSNIGPKILPLFYGLSVSDLEGKGMQKMLFQKWMTLAEVDPRIVVNDWKHAFDVLKSFNGLSYVKNSKEILAYEDEIVSYVCKSIAPDIKWDDSLAPDVKPDNSLVHGKSSICKVIVEKIEGIAVSKNYKVKVVGIHGVSGIGKTTTCKTLCNEVLIKYKRRVCHIEFPSVPSSDSKELFQKVLRDLTTKSVQVIQQLNEEECKDILRKSLSKQRTFLAMDNISDNHQSIQHAKTFLEVPYHKESLVVVTARSQGVLELLGLDEDACLEMPDLGEVDAMNLFLHHAAGGKQFVEDGEKHDVMTRVERCYFSKGNGGGYHYHPLALQSLGLQLSCHGEHPSLWVKNLPRVKTFNFFSRGNPVFDILRSSFDLLSPRDQALFMDVGCFSNWIHHSPFLDIEWLCAVHMQAEEEIALRLENLQQKGLLQDVDLKSRRISMHDLYLEFAELEAMGSFNESSNLRERMWIKNNDLVELESKQEGGCWHKLIRLSIIQGSLGPEKDGGIVGRIGGTVGIKWNNFSNVEVLQLSGLHWGHGSLNLEGLLSLRVLELLDVSGIDRIEGLEKLKHLTYFVWTSSKWNPRREC